MKYLCMAVLGCWCVCCSLHAQLCTGSLGDPVVHITFGNSTTARAPLKAGITNLSYVDECPNDGSYTITSVSQNCFSGAWFPLNNDHTGDPGGRVMLINASYDPSDFYVDTVKGLCNNTVYEFAAWAANISRSSSCGGNSILPNISFRIESVTGVLLKEVSSGDMSAGTSINWQQYGTFFATPAGTGEVVLRIRNNSKGGCGNDLMLDDITFRACGPKITTMADNAATNEVVVCDDARRNVVLSASYSGGFTDPVLQWQVSNDSGKTWVDIMGEQQNTYTAVPGAAGYYQYRVTIVERANLGSVQCRVASAVTTVRIPSFVNNPYAIIAGCKGTTAQISAAATGNYQYQWAGPGGFSSNLASVSFSSLAYTDSGLYRVTASAYGCSSTDSIYLQVNPAPAVSVSNDAGICEGNTTTITASGGVQYQWSPARGLSDASIASPVASPSDTTRYTVTVTNSYGCTDSASVVVNIWKKPVADAGPDRQIFEGDTVTLRGTVSGTDVSVVWTPAISIQNANTITPVVNPSDKTVYTLTATSALGCGVSDDQVIVNVYKKISPPNIFSPNGDGVNDTWVIPGIETLPRSQVHVYDRMGRIVFSTRSAEKVWDGMYKGKPIPVGTYYYIIETGLNQPPLSGWVLIMR